MPKEQFNSELDRLFNECSEDDWDGYGASPIALEALNHAKSFVAKLPDDLIPMDIGATPDGAITLEWYRSANKVASISIYPDGDFQFAYMIFNDKGAGAIVNEDFCDIIRKVINERTV